MFSRNGVPKVLRALFSTGQGKQQHNSPPLVLTFNSGSSSVKFQALNPLTRSVVLSGSGERLGTEEASVTIKWAEDGSKRKTIVPWVSVIGHISQSGLIVRTFVVGN